MEWGAERRREGLEGNGGCEEQWGAGGGAQRAQQGGEGGLWGEGVGPLLCVAQNAAA